jgi:hypothetical protein
MFLRGVFAAVKKARFLFWQTQKMETTEEAACAWKKL